MGGKKCSYHNDAKGRGTRFFVKDNLWRDSLLKYAPCFTQQRVHLLMVFKVVYGEISHIFLCLVRRCVSLHLCVWGYAQ